MENKFFRLQHLKAQLKRFIPVPFLVLALTLFIYSVRTLSPSQPVRLAIVNWSESALFLVKVPLDSLKHKWENMVSYFNLYEENQRLKTENHLLQSWKNIAVKLAYEQREMSQLLNYTPMAPAKEYVVRVLTDYNSPFAQSVILSGGTNIGLKKGDILLTNKGLYGRIVETSAKTSRAIKLTDYFSRLPVLVGKKAYLCMLGGDNTPYPKLLSVPEEALIQEGDYVMSSGTAGVYPSGISIGTIKKKDNEYLVELFENAPHLEFVRVADFGLDGILSETGDIK